MKLLHHPESDCVFIGNLSEPDWYAGVHDVCAADLPLGTRIAVGMGESEVLASFDFETYSEAGFNIDPSTGKVKGAGSQGKGGLPVVGTPVYAEHPSTDVVCLCYNLKDGNGVQTWVPGAPNPQPLIDYLLRGGIIEAWNITFEFWIWNMVGVRKYGWPPLPLNQCRCAMAKSRRRSLPGALGKAAKVLGTLLKDPAGGRLIQKLSRPHTPTKNRKAHRWTPQTAWADFVEFYRYCGIDVDAEDDASARIPDLTPDELNTWLLDQTINARGVQVDMAALDAAIDILGQTERKYNAELGRITGGIVQAASELPAMRAWLATCGLDMPDMQKDTITETLKRTNLPPEARRVLEIRDTLGAANVKKLRTLKLQTSSDGRLRDQYMYCGADRTGRACIAKGEPVLVKAPDGRIFEVPIEELRIDHMLWDGREWVTHGGLSYSGKRGVVTHDGVTATPDHRVFTSTTEYETIASLKKTDRPIFRGERPCPLVPTE